MISYNYVIHFNEHVVRAFRHGTSILVVYADIYIALTDRLLIFTAQPDDFTLRNSH